MGGGEVIVATQAVVSLIADLAPVKCWGRASYRDFAELRLNGAGTADVGEGGQGEEGGAGGGRVLTLCMPSKCQTTWFLLA